MVIAITGASGQVGTLLLRRLAEASVDALPLNQGDDWAAAIARADTVVHLAGTLQPKGRNSYESANVETTTTVATAARESGVGRLVFLSYVGADPASPNAYLRSKATAEKLLLDSGVPTTIFRCLHIYGPPDSPGPTAGAFVGKGRRAVPVPGNGSQLIEPLYVADAPTGTFELGGPERMTMDDFVRALNGPEVRIRHIPPGLARLLAHLSPSLTSALMDLLLADNITATPSAEIGERFGFTPHWVADIWTAGRALSGPQASLEPADTALPMAGYREFFNPGTGEWVEYLVTGEESDGALVRYRWRSVPGGSIPEHFHPKQEERFEIESGEAHFTRDGEEIVAGAGDTVVIPAGARHSEWNAGEVEVRGTVELRPALGAKELHEMFAGLNNDGMATRSGAPKNPLQLGATFWHFREDIRASSPPPWLQNLFLPPLWALGRAVGIKPYYERWDSKSG